MEKSKLHIFYVHGAWASKDSFNYIYKSLPDHNAFFMQYEFNCSLEEISESIKNKIDLIISKMEKYILIGHSMGGLICHKIAQNSENCKTLITLASPYGGSFFASLAQKKAFVNKLKFTFENNNSKNIFIDISKFPQFPDLLFFFKDYSNLLISDLEEGSFFLNSLKKLDSKVEHVSFIANGGKFPLFNEQNDNVLTVRSQEKSPANIKIYVDTTHSEILLNDSVVEKIKEIIFLKK